MLSLIAIAAAAIGVVIGWKVRGYWESRPSILKAFGRKKAPPAGPAATDGNGTGRAGGLINGLSKIGGKIIGKGLEAVFGKPKPPKDDKEKK